MQTTWEQTLWINHNPIYRQIIAFVVSLIVLVLILMIPVSLYHHFDSQDNVIEVELSKEDIVKNPVSSSEEKTDDLPSMKPNLVNEPVKKPIVHEKPVPIKQVIQIKNKPISVTPNIVKQSTNPEDEQIEKLPSSAVIFNSAYGKVKLYELDDDFKARTGNENDFKFREIKQPEWNVVTKLIDEEVDKPRVEMNFYSAGIIGATEKFFDKISYKKVFTTRYGTKIACGGVGPLLMCSWK